MKRKRLALPLILAVVLTFNACSTDSVIDGLKVADTVAQAAIPIISPVNQPLATVMQKVSSDLEIVVKTYQDYESAAPGDKPAKATLIKATASAIQGNLSDILAAIGVKNPEIKEYVSVAVAVVNSALVVVLAKLPAEPQSAVSARSATKSATLPTVEGAKTAQDLKNAWNNAIKTAYPGSKI
jgi:hypothetical protein